MAWSLAFGFSLPMIQFNVGGFAVGAELEVKDQCAVRGCGEPPRAEVVPSEQSDGYQWTIICWKSSNIAFKLYSGIDSGYSTIIPPRSIALPLTASMSSPHSPIKRLLVANR